MRTVSDLPSVQRPASFGESNDDRQTRVERAGLGRIS